MQVPPPLDAELPVLELDPWELDAVLEPDSLWEPDPVLELDPWELDAVLEPDSLWEPC